jgi:hypothetical protein
MHILNMMNVAYKRDMGIAAGTEGSILKVLAYFSIFYYPLTRTEIMKYLPPGICIDTVDDALEQLVNEGVVFRIAEFYLLQNDSLLVKRRREGNMRAERLLPKAMKIGRFLAKFPYVRGVGISGSLSKMCADEKADIDFFIITRADRLWIARTFMHVFKKLTFLTGRQHLYCMNYYVDEKSMKLEDQDIYTAIETATLLPVSGPAIHDFFAANDWVSGWFADYPNDRGNNDDMKGTSWIKTAIEWMLNNKAGSSIDSWLMRFTASRWQKKKQKGKRNEEGREMALVTDKHFARSNPGRFREKLLAAHEEILNAMRKRYPGYF